MVIAEPLAKSHPPLTLRDHTLEVLRYVESVIEAYHPIWLDLLGPQDAEILVTSLRLAAAAHDLGKATVGFQRSLSDRSFRWQFRHEVLSTALLLAAASIDPAVRRFASAAVLTHHRDLTDSQLETNCGLPALPKAEFLVKAREQFRQRVEELAAFWEWLHTFWSRLPVLAEYRLPEHWSAVESPATFLRQLQNESQALHPFRSREGFLFTLARGWLLAADHAASAGVPMLKATLPQGWERQYPQQPLVSSQAGQNSSLRAFQRALGEHVGSAVLMAPTGAGKTHAALRWIARNRRAGERVFYVLPYQASIEAMGQTLSAVFGQELVGVLHARALEVAFQRYFSDEDDYSGAYEAARAESELNRLVHKPIKVTTPFQLIKWLFGIKRYELGLAELTGALVVFDEIHAYDAHVTALVLELVRVLRELGGRCLFMSATFPTFLREEIERAWGAPLALFRLDTPPARDDWASVFLTTSRHELLWADDPLEELVDHAVAAVHSGKRVLVVANRVQQAQTLYTVLREQLDTGVHLLHGRFTRRDRVEREQKILAALRGMLAFDIRALVSTQVVEVSLDVSFDTMLTEIAPVDDLLQRLGRVNRYYEHGRPVPVLISRTFDPVVQYVYDPERLQMTAGTAPPHGTCLTAVDAEEWVGAVYRDGWTTNEGTRFEQALASFRSVIDGLRPLQTVETAYEEFYQLFQGVEVLPEAFLEEYTRHSVERRALLASQLLVPLPMGTFWKLCRANRISQLKDGTLVAAVNYDPELGLLPDATSPEFLAI
uniref:CRISPR-associated helicase Cas3 n=1 Tax=Thermomicrobium roseum TaxID=500 RepID=A0A7C5RUN1_THERO